MGSGGRWDVEGPLNVICASVSQDQERRKLCGPRLLTLVGTCVFVLQLYYNDVDQ